MSDHKVKMTPMSIEYKLIFLAAIILLLVNIGIGITNIGDKTSSGSLIPILVWTYVIWKMWKRDNKALESIFNVLFWITLVGSILLLLVVISAKPSYTSHHIISAAFLLFIIYLMRFLRNFFRDELNKNHSTAGNP